MLENGKVASYGRFRHLPSSPDESQVKFIQRKNKFLKALSFMKNNTDDSDFGGIDLPSTSWEESILPFTNHDKKLKKGERSKNHPPENIRDPKEPSQSLLPKPANNKCSDTIIDLESSSERVCDKTNIKGTDKNIIDPTEGSSTDKKDHKILPETENPPVNDLGGSLGTNDSQDGDEIPPVPYDPMNMDDVVNEQGIPPPGGLSSYYYIPDSTKKRLPDSVPQDSNKAQRNLMVELDSVMELMVRNNISLEDSECTKLADHLHEITPVPDTFSDNSMHDVKGGKGDYTLEEAKQTELKKFVTHGTFIECSKENVPEGTKIISGRWVEKENTDEAGKTVFKARFVVRGFEEPHDPSGEDNYSPTTIVSMVRMMLADAWVNNLAVAVADISSAFLNAHLDTPLYCYPPPEYKGSKKNCIWLLRKSLYGLRCAPALWHSQLANILRSQELDQGLLDTCFFMGRDLKTTFHVDDLLITGPSGQITDLIKALESKLALKWQFVEFSPIKFLGRILQRAEDGFVFSNDTQAAKLALEAFGLSHLAPLDRLQFECDGKNYYVT